MIDEQKAASRRADDLADFLSSKGYTIFRNGRVCAPNNHAPTLEEHAAFLEMKTVYKHSKLISDQPPIELVEQNILEYWAQYHVGGSGLSIGIQKTLRDMAAEILKLRGITSEKQN